MSEALELHAKYRGKIATASKMPLRTRKDLSLAYTPGVAAVSSAVARDKDKAYEYTIKGNYVAVVSDGSAVLGLGDIGPEGALPVMEGKCLLMKELAGVDAFPICVNVHSPDEIVAAVKAIAPVFGAVNLEDIKAPGCFEIEGRLKKELDIPVMHDDQHATAVVVLAGLINAFKVTGKDKEAVKVVINGAGAAGIATAKMLYDFGVENILLVDTIGAIYEGRDNLNEYKAEVAKFNKDQKGSLSDVIKEADVFIGLSTGGCVAREMVQSMNPNPVVFAMANPDPEIMPGDAEAAGASVIATGRSDFPNQINNVLVFPGIFKGTLESKATEINETMKLAAAHAIASLIEMPTAEKIVPDVLDKRVVPAVAEAVAGAAEKTGVVRK